MGGVTSLGADMKELIDKLLEEEGITTWMYKDSKDIVTCGVGHALFTVENALVLPWNQTPVAIKCDYDAVKAAPGGYRASWYASLTKSRLAPEYVHQLLEADIDANIVILRKYFPYYGSYPKPAQLALADMAFNLGGHFPKAWPKLRDAVTTHDWCKAADECHRQGISQARNTRTQELFKSAVLIGV